MEQFFIYLIKSSGLLAMFYLAYQFLIQKETFFNTNRWFLLSGLLASLLLPLVTIKKIVYIEVPKATVDKFMVYSQPNNSISKELPTVEAFHWIDYVWVVYIAIAMILVVKIIISIVSLYKMLLKQQIVVKENIKFIDLNKNIAPFHFLNILFLTLIFTTKKNSTAYYFMKKFTVKKNTL